MYNLLFFVMYLQDWMRNMSNEWKNLTIEDKNKYIAKAERLSEKYKIELKHWEENMIREGHQDLLKSTLKSKRNTAIDKHKEQDSECPSQSSMQIPESIAADFFKVRIRNKENIKTGWGTDTQYTLGSISDIDSGNRKIILA